MLVVKGINIWVAAGFVFIYTVYVIIVVVQSKQTDKDDEHDKEINVKA